MTIGRKKIEKLNTEALRAQRKWEKSEARVELRATAVRAEGKSIIASRDRERAAASPRAVSHELHKPIRRAAEGREPQMDTDERGGG